LSEAPWGSVLLLGGV